MTQAEYLAPCMAAIAGATLPMEAAEAIKKEIRKISGAIKRGDLDREAITEELREAANASGLFADVGLGMIYLAISEALSGGNGHDSSAWTPQKLLLSSAEFISGFVPPDYLIDGLMQRRFCYSLTAATGAGKTAIALLFAISVAEGRKIGNIKVEQGNVIYFAGENADDVRMRWFAQCKIAGVEPEDVHNVSFVPGIHRMSEIFDQVAEETDGHEVALVIIDTSAAYSEADDENSNVQMGKHARRMRGFCQLNGGPSVLILAHPTKNADPENLQPRGGGAFIAEVDGNFVCRKTESTVELSWQGKFRGPEISPVTFELKMATHERLVDSKGRKIYTIIANPISEDVVDGVKINMRKEENEVLAMINANGFMSERAMATQLGWMTTTLQPHKTKVQRAIAKLEKYGMIRAHRDGYELTERGKKELG